MTTKQALHRLIDDLPERELPAVERVLEGLRDGRVDPLRLALLAAPYDDEDETDEERAAVSAAREQLAQDQIIADDALWQQLGHPYRQ